VNHPGGLALFAIMLGVFFAGLFWRRLPIGVALLVAAAVGLPVSGMGIPLRHLVEGAFTYFDPMMIIFSAMFFMKVIEADGSLRRLAVWFLSTFGRSPALGVVVMTLFIMFPAMLTGISTTSVLTTGALMAPPLIASGLSRTKTAALIGFVSVMGMLAPPINLLAMVIGQGVDMPYIGFAWPLLTISLPPALAGTILMGYKALKKADIASAVNALPGDSKRKTRLPFLPLGLVLGLMIAIRLMPGQIPDVGIPTIFMAGIIAALMLNGFAGVGRSLYDSLRMSLPVLGLLAGVGAFLQVMTLTGARGELVVAVLGLPAGLKYAGLAVALPFFGGISAFASSMVFGVPFLLSFLGSGSEIVICAGLTVLAGLGDLLPPGAINARFAVQVAGADRLTDVIRTLAPYLLTTALLALAAIHWSGHLNWLVSR